ncbi:MAG: ABC transporter ATP-binding protein [Acidimicrobiales bacterium]
MSLLEASQVTKRFGGLVALDQVSLEVDEGEIVGLLGPNGSGKTTLFDCITGVLPADGGIVMLQGKVLSGQRPWEAARLGVARTFQVLRVFQGITVLDNMLVARRWNGVGTLRSLGRPRHADIARAWDLLRFMRIDRLGRELANTLSLGQQRLLELAMALMPEPSVVLLDEATSGVNPSLIEEIKDRIRELNAQGVTFFLIEHNMGVAMDLCQRLYVLHHGQLLAKGTPEEIQADDAVVEAYFGG